MQRIQMGVWDGRERIGEVEQAAGEVGMRVAAQGEHDRFFAVDHPDPAFDGPFDAVVDFTADDGFVDAESHINFQLPSFDFQFD